MSGLMSVTGLPGQGPVRTGAAIADPTAGLYAAIGVMIALIERQTSGKGQWVQSSLLQAGISLLDFQAARYLMEGDAAAGRQRSPHQHADLGLQDEGRPHQRGSFGRGHVDEPARPWGAKTCCRRRSSRAARSARRTASS